jgi:hypothetical protein
MDKQNMLELPVSFQFPIGASPEQCSPAIEAWAHDPQDKGLFTNPGYKVKDLEGVHIWRNAHTGEEMVSNGLKEAHWGGWSIQPQTKTINNEWDSIGMPYENVFYIHHWVLCTNLTSDQYQEWETYRRLRKAGIEQGMKYKEAIQLEF